MTLFTCKHGRGEIRGLFTHVAETQSHTNESILVTAVYKYEIISVSVTIYIMAIYSHAQYSAIDLQVQFCGFCLFKYKGKLRNQR